jgi:hypothetical protein
MQRQGYRLRLTNIEPGAWRVTFSHDAVSAAEVSLLKKSWVDRHRDG